MRVYGRKIAVLLLVGMLLTAVSAMPAAEASNAGGQAGLVFNGKDYQADIYIKNGVSYISAAALEKIPGLEVEGDDDVPLRSFFTGQGGSVYWDKGKQNVIVLWRDMHDGWSADGLVVESSRLLQEKNTYKMEGSAIIKMDVAGSSGDAAAERTEMASTMAGTFQQQPLAMYIRQTIKLPQGFPGQEMDSTTGEPLLPMSGGDMQTEMVWAENKIYQKTPLAEQWIVQDLTDTDMMGNLTSMLQTTPQKSLEMMREFGILYVFGDDVVIDGQEYYTISNYIDSITFRKVLTEYMAGFDMAGFPRVGASGGMSDQGEEGAADPAAGFGEMLQRLLETMEINYYVHSYINKETLLTDHMAFDMDMEYSLDETLNPEGAVCIKMAVSGDFKLYDLGAGIELPDLSDAVAQQEFMEQMLNKMETSE